MKIDDLATSHSAYFNILKTRGMEGLNKNMPLWKLKLTDIEYENLKKTLRSHLYDIHNYGIEAALCYAEWWRRDYNGNIPSKEDVAMGIGIDRNYGEEIYKAARLALKKHGYEFIHSLKRTEYFRTLLNQGGLPVNYIKNSQNLGSFSKFLKELVRELSNINYNWNEENNDIIKQFNCISYLGNAFKNENIYDVAMQIAHAIIMDDNNLLPYDDTDASLSELTKSLKNEYRRAKTERRPRPLSLHWKLITSPEGYGQLFVNMDVVKDIYSDSIPGLDFSTCYTFDIFVANSLVGKYVRKSLNKNEVGEIINATYSRISVGMSKDILWKGEPVVEVKIRCDNDQRIFMTITGCYPPNFERPQVFQMLDENIYSMRETANTECNIAVFSPEWNVNNSRNITINGQSLLCEEFTDILQLTNSNTGEKIFLTNKFTPYSVEFSGNYIPWIEKSNFKLLTKTPIIRVYDKEKNSVQKFKTKYRIRKNGNDDWFKLNSSCILPTGLVDINVEFPDGHSVTESFYYIGNMKFDSSNENIFSTEIVCLCDSTLRTEIEENDNLDIEKLETNKWKIYRNNHSPKCPTVCGFRFYKSGNPVLYLSVAIPFDGIMITDIDGNIVPNGKIISFSNLEHYRIICHGSKNRYIHVSYNSEHIEDIGKIKHFKSHVLEGLLSLSDYRDLIVRIFNLYGAHSFDRSSSVVLNISGKKIYIRKFVLESTIENDKINIIDKTESDISDFIYDGDLYAMPVGNTVPTEDFFPVRLLRVSENENIFEFPTEFTYNEIIIFSGPAVKRRIVPKYYNRKEQDYNNEERSIHTSKNTQSWYDILMDENVFCGKHWNDVCRAFEICSNYNLPFTTYNGLKSIARDAKLLAKFVISMWLNNYTDILIQDIERFEQEMVVAIHWIPKKIWENCINNFRDELPVEIGTIMTLKMQSFIMLIQELFDSTLSADISSGFTIFLFSDEKAKDGKAFSNEEITIYRSKIRGLNDNSWDLPTVEHSLKRKYYPHQDNMPPYQRVMIESAMCAAENTCRVENCTNLFSYDEYEKARIVNFYRNYFRETYSEIFFKTVKCITTLN